MSGAAASRPKTRIQREKQDLILDAALDVFSLHGFRGATIDQIADAARIPAPRVERLGDDVLVIGRMRAVPGGST